MIATAGDRFRRQLVDEGVVANKIRVTGQPRLDLVRRTSQGPEKRDEKTGHRVLLFCSQPIPEPQLARELFRDIVLACDELDDVKLLVKLHPRDADIGEWLRLLPHNAGRSLLDVTKTRGLDWCLREADGMMTIASTTCLEAMAVGLPVALVNYLPISWYLPYDAMGAAISIAKKDELRDAIRRLLYDEPLRTSLCRHSEEVLRDELFLRDGASASRIVDFIEDECVGHC
jgi:UDP-N-acetylglucosamine 2-epimerase